MLATTPMTDATKPRPESRRLLAAQLFAQGKSYLEVARIFSVSEEAARKWKLRWDEGGKKALRERREAKRGPRPAISDKDAKALIAEARKQGIADNLSAVCHLADKRKLDVSRSALRRRLVALGLWPKGSKD